MARLTVLSGPSGVGKGSVVAAVRRRHPEVWVSVSVTTRAPRPGEVDGEHYHFVDDERFSELVAAGELLEYATYGGHRYGTPRAPVARASWRRPPGLARDRPAGRSPGAGVDAGGAAGLSGPSRLGGAGPPADRAGPPSPTDVVAERLAVAGTSWRRGTEFDHQLVNHDVDSAADELVNYMVE